MGRSKSAPAKALPKPPTRGRPKRSWKPGAETQGRKPPGLVKIQLEAAKKANEQKLCAKLAEKLECNNIRLSQGLEMLSDPLGGTVPMENDAASDKGEKETDEENEESDEEQQESDEEQEEEQEESEEELEKTDEKDHTAEVDEDFDDDIEDVDYLPSDEDEKGVTPAKKAKVSEKSADTVKGSQQKRAAPTLSDSQKFPMPIKSTPSSLEGLLTPGPSKQAAVTNKPSPSVTDDHPLVNHWKSKYLKQLDKNKQLSKDLLTEKAKSSHLNGLIVTQMSIIRELKKGKPFDFTEEPGINMTTTQIRNIHLESKHTCDFVQRLALYFYGADGLRYRRVTTKGSSNSKPISPEKLRFMHNKARERVALIAGIDDYDRIATEAGKAVLNKALGDKIQNLRKQLFSEKGRSMENDV